MEVCHLLVEDCLKLDTESVQFDWRGSQELKPDIFYIIRRNTVESRNIIIFVNNFKTDHLALNVEADSTHHGPVSAEPGEDGEDGLRLSLHDARLHSPDRRPHPADGPQ